MTTYRFQQVETPIIRLIALHSSFGEAPWKVLLKVNHSIIGEPSWYYMILGRPTMSVLELYHTTFKRSWNFWLTIEWDEFIESKNCQEITISPKPRQRGRHQNSYASSIKKDHRRFTQSASKSICPTWGMTFTYILHLLKRLYRFSSLEISWKL